MRRRAFFAFAGALAFGAGGAATAQSQPKRYRIGMLGGNPTAQPAQFDRLKRRLAELGYVDGRDIVFERRFHRGRIEQVPELAAELVQLRPDVIVATGPEAVLKAVSSATTNIPIVFVAVDYDPVALGYIANLPRPGGNLTGLFLRQVELTAKRAELLKEALPGLTDLAVFADAFTTKDSEQMRAVEGAAARLGVRVVPLILRGAPYDFPEAIETARAKGAGAVLALMTPGFFSEQEHLVRALSAGNMPASFGLREFADRGGLMSYGANIVEMYDRVADYVAKILHGAKPADLPIEQPTKFELVINLKTAKALGLSLPQSILARADEVIE
jgi:putative ABC transport system substrate-binding protein